MPLLIASLSFLSPLLALLASDVTPYDREIGRLKGKTALPPLFDPKPHDPPKHAQNVVGSFVHRPTFAPFWPPLHRSCLLGIKPKALTLAQCKGVYMLKSLRETL